jgi:citrate synthase
MPARKEREPFHWRTAISYKTADRLVVRGYDITELIDSISFSDMFYLVLRSELPGKQEAQMMNAILVASAEHGFSPSIAAARMVAAGRAPLTAAVAAGTSAYGEAHGPIHRSAEMLQEYLRKGKEDNCSIDETAQKIVSEHGKISGIHQPQHPRGDPRARKLLGLAQELGLFGEHCQLMVAVEAKIAEKRGKKYYINICGAASAILSDLGFRPEEAWSVVFISHAVGCAAHAIEEKTAERAWRTAASGGSMSLFDLTLQGKQHYYGPKDRKIPPEEAPGE